MKFIPKTTDFTVSPYTGLTRESWLEAAEYVLNGIFSNISSFEEPVVMPRKETEITYPHKNSSPEALEAECKAEKFEGLTRSFFFAAPLIHENPETEICGYNIREYYKNQVLRSCTKTDPIYVGTYEDLQEADGWRNPNRCFQQTVETCALVICLWMCKEEIWDTYTKAERDLIAGFIASYAHANTVPQNWRLFNMLDLAFLHMEGYPASHEIMMDHAQAILAYSVGDGWYRDGHSFDYYSCWAFQVYAPLWNLWYGYEHEPELARRFEEQSNRLMETYADFFDRDGYTNMWGRSGIYRNASTSAFDANFFLKHPKMNPGLARRICSGSLLQFFGREDVFTNGGPELGFYGQFSPLVQGYSCAESPFWMGKAFLCLHLPKEHPFWTAKENNGTWEELGPEEVKVTTLNGPALCFSNHNANGETILRTGKVLKNKGDIHGMWNYSKLCFNTKYPWEAAPAEGIESQQYVMRELPDGHDRRANVTFWYGEKDRVLYRRQFFDYNLNDEAHWIPAINLADFTVPYGVIRVDKHRLFQRPVRFTLGAYGFPDNGETELLTREDLSMGARAMVVKGYDSLGNEKQLAMTIYDGLDDLRFVHSTGTNPDSENSIVVYAVTEKKKQYGSSEFYTMISQVITKESHEAFAEEELFPIAKVEYEDSTKTGAYGTITVTLKDGTVRRVNFDEMEAGLCL
ncbi:MAG: DUF2264 domain-containing protein [Lachnospiraceae bacterium]|nr:DUF2264 domain-containing protein [Lachnospiraceae bacterium]